MSSRDKLGVAILVGLFIVLGALMIWSMPERPAQVYSPEDSPIVQQRLRNIEKTSGL